MKNYSSSLLRTLSVLALLPVSLPAATQFWDPDGSTVGTSVSGNWDTATANWTSTTDSGVNTTWTPGNDATFGIAADYTVTATEPISVGFITVSGSAGVFTFAASSGNSLNLASPSTLTTGGRNINISAPINGSFAVTRVGAGTVTLSGASTYSGGTTLSAGTTSLGLDSVYSGSIISGPLGTGPVNVSAAATISPSGARILDNPITLNAGLTIGGAATLTFRNSNFTISGGNRTLTINDTADVTIAGNLADDGIARTFTKAGTAGRLILAGDNSGFLGNVTINASGTLSAGSASAIKMLQTSSVLTANGTLDLNGFDGQVVGLAGSGTVTLGTNTLTITSAGTSRNFTGIISGTGGLVFSNIISHQLEGQNTFGGGILIKAGTVFLRTNAAVGSSITRAAGTGTITMIGTDPVVANVTAAIGGNLVAGTVQITNAIVLSSGRVLLFPSNGGTVEYDGTISGPGGILRDGNGAGPAVIMGNNTYSGGLHIEGRAVGLGHKNAPGTGEFVLGNPITAPGNSIVIIPFANLSGANAITNVTTINQPFAVAPTNGNGFELSGPIALSNTVVITSVGDSLFKLSGNVAGPGGFTLAGTNNLVLTGANTYEGVTFLTGPLLVNNTSGSATGTNSVTVTTGGTLGGNGRIYGPVTAGFGATISPGTSIGRLTISNSLSLSGATTLMELDKSSGTNDSIVGLSSVTYGGTLIVTNLAGTLAGGDTFKLFSASSYGGTFDAILLPPLTGSLTWNTNTLAVNGTISVSAGGASISSIVVSGANVSIGGSGGTPFHNYYVLTSTNVLLPLTNWASIATNQFDSNGNFNFSTPINPAIPTRFYVLQVP